MKATRYLTAGLLAAAIGVSSSNLIAQERQNNRPDGNGRPDRGNFDPEQMRQRFMERIREQLEVKDEGEWKLVSTRLEKVMEQRRGGGAGGGFGFFGGPGGPPRNDGERSSGRPPGADSDSQRQNRGGGFSGRFGQEDPESAALRTALEAKASNEELKRKIEAVKVARDKRQEALKKAQDELKQVLSVRQEAIATSMGFL